MFGGFKNNAYLCIVKLSYRGFEPHIVSQIKIRSNDCNSYYHYADLPS